MVWDQLQKIGVRHLPLSAVTFDAYRADGRTFEAAEAFKEEDRNLTGGGLAERVSVTSCTPELLEMLGARARFGRLLTSTDPRRPRLHGSGHIGAGVRLQCEARRRGCLDTAPSRG
jgi:hypothetical protein